MRGLQAIWRRVPALAGLLIYLAGCAFTTVLAVDWTRTGVAAGKHGAGYYRAETGPFTRDGLAIWSACSRQFYRD